MAPSHAIIWSKRATTDLERILKFIAADKPLAAQQLAVAIKARIGNLQMSPYLGRHVVHDLHELVVHRHYVVVYRVRKNQVQIVQIRHAARIR